VVNLSIRMSIGSDNLLIQIRFIIVAIVVYFNITLSP